MLEIFSNLRDKLTNSKSEKILSEEYWTNMAIKTAAAEYAKKKDCNGWTKRALEVLKEDGLESFFKFNAVQGTYKTPLWREFGIWGHSWLAHSHGQEKFIADGTAGQFLPNLPDGYYGYLSNAPEPLKKIYTLSTLGF